MCQGGLGWEADAGHHGEAVETAGVWWGQPPIGIGGWRGHTFSLGPDQPDGAPGGVGLGLTGITCRGSLKERLGRERKAKSTSDLSPVPP